MRSFHKTKYETAHDNRTKFLVAVIFLFAFAIMVKIFNLQVFQYDLYSARAMQQHDVVEDIMPERGRIFVRSQDEQSNLYPLASNKEFALVYAVPKEMNNIEQDADKLVPVLYPLVYEEPDRETLMAAIENNIREQMFAEAIAKNPPESGQEVILDENEVMIAMEKQRLILDEQLKKEKEDNIKDYTAELLKKFGKRNDPYEPLIQKVDKDKLQEIMDLNIEGIHYSLSSYRYYPEKNISSNILGFVVNNPNNEITQGSYGLEGYFNDVLSGTIGSLHAEKDARGRLIITADRNIKPAVDGSDIILTINKTIQDVACRKLNLAAVRHGADLGSVIIMNPKSGAILAMCSYPDFDPNEYGKTKDVDYFNNAAIFDAYEPGSIFKSITMAAGIDTDMFNPDTTFVDTGSVTIAGETIKNADDKVYGEATMTEVLENSINTGAMHVAKTIGINNFRKYVNDFGFGQKTGIELKTEVAGNISSLYDKMHGDDLNMAVASFGQSITTTPLQMVAAYAAIANQGILVKPYIVDEIINSDGTRIKTQTQEIRRVISPRTALLLSGMLVNVVDSGHATLAGVKGYYVAGKTGTAQIASLNTRGYSNRTSHSFVGFAPASDPKFVMIVYLKDPKDVKFSASSAAPLFGDIAEFVLNYYQIEKER